MKPSHFKKETCLKALLFAVVGANFVAGLNTAVRPSANVTSLSTVNDAADDTGTSGPAAPQPQAPALDLSQPPKDVPQTLSPIAPPGPKLPALAQSKPFAEAVKKGSPLKEAAIVSPPLREPAPSTEAIPEPEEDSIKMCENHVYQIVYSVKKTGSEITSSASAYPAGARHAGKPAAHVIDDGDANKVSVHKNLKDAVYEKLQDLAANKDCFDTNPETPAEAVKTCEQDSAGKALSEVAQMDCAQSRIKTLNTESPRLEGEDYMQELSDSVDKIKVGLKKIADHDCGDERGAWAAACNRGGIDKVIKDVTATLKRIKDTHGYAVRGDKDATREGRTKIDHMIASLKAVIVASKGEKEAKKISDAADQLKDDIAQKRSDIARDTQECESDAREAIQNGMGQGFANDIIQTCKATIDSEKSDLADLEQQHKDLFKEAYLGGANGEFQDVIDLKSSMDKDEWSDLVHEVRDPFMEALHDVRNADTSDPSLPTNQMDMLINQINHVSSSSGSGAGNMAGGVPAGRGGAGDLSRSQGIKFPLVPPPIGMNQGAGPGQGFSGFQPNGNQSPSGVALGIGGQQGIYGARQVPFNSQPSFGGQSMMQPTASSLNMSPFANPNSGNTFMTGATGAGVSPFARAAGTSAAPMAAAFTTGNSNSAITGSGGFGR